MPTTQLKKVRAKIVSDGTAEGTKLLINDAEVVGLVSVEWMMRPWNGTSAIIHLQTVELEVEGVIEQHNVIDLRNGLDLRRR